MKKILAVLLAAVLSLSVITGCSSGSGGSSGAASQSKTSSTAEASSDAGGEKKKLTVWVEKIFSDEANNKMEEKLTQWGTDNNVEMKVEMIAGVDFMTKLNAAVEADQVPDVTTGAMAKVLSYYPNLPYMEVTELVDQINSERPYFDSIYEGTKIEGKNYYVPYTSSSCLMFVRKDLLEAKGITKVPSTWDEVFDAAEKVADPDNGIYGLGMGCGPNDSDCENMVRNIIWNYGGSLVDKDGNATCNSDPFKKVVGKIVELYNAGVIPPAATTWDASGNNKSYLMGESAIVFNAPTLYGALQGDDQYKELLDNTTVTNLPGGPDNSVTLGYDTGWSIMEGSENVDAAKEMIGAMMDKDWYAQYMQMTAPVLAPLFKDMKEDSFWQQPVNKDVMAYAENAGAYYGYPAETMKNRAVIAKQMFTYPMCKLTNSVITSGTSLDDAIAALEKDINDVAANIG